MSRVYESIEEAKEMAAYYAGVDYDSTIFEEVSGLTVGGIFEDILLSDKK